MKKPHLYFYTDPYCTELETNIVHHVTEGDRLWVALEQTIIYPGGGGQAMDQAQINGIAVRDAKYAGNRLLYAVDASSSLAVWNPVTVRIDANVRMYNMQQHSGQHLMSAVFADGGYSTVSAHLGENYTAIEVDGGTPSSKELADFEMACNAYIRSALTIQTYFKDAKDAAKLPLRKPVKKGLQEVRIVQIDKLDYSACAGTHVATTAGIGLIKIIGIEKIRGRVRVIAKIGHAAMTYFHQLQNTVHSLGKMLDSPPRSIAEAVQKNLDEKNRLFKENKKLRKNMAQNRAAVLQAENPDGIISGIIDETDDAPEICRALIQSSGRPVFLLTGSRFFFAKPRGSDFDLVAFMQSKGPGFGMRGGGPPEFVQGVYKNGNAEKLLRAIRDAWKK